MYRLFSSADDWDTTPVYCIEINEGAFASKITAIMTEIWTDCMTMLKDTADSWKATIRYADHALPFEAIRRKNLTLSGRVAM